MSQRIPVAVLGATGAVGQKFVTLLADHPWFEIAALGASERSAGKRYGDVVHWLDAMPLPRDIADMTVLPCEPALCAATLGVALDQPAGGPLRNVSTIPSM